MYDQQKDHLDTTVPWNQRPFLGFSALQFGLYEGDGTIQSRLTGLFYRGFYVFHRWGIQFYIFTRMAVVTDTRSFGTPKAGG
jgi:hypothetical protein